MTNKRVEELARIYKAMARAAIADGIPIETEGDYESLADWSKKNFNSPLSQWVRRNCKCRPESEFFVVWGVAIEMGHIKQAEVNKQKGIKNARPARRPKGKKRNPPGPS